MVAFKQPSGGTVTAEEMDLRQQLCELHRVYKEMVYGDDEAVEALVVTHGRPYDVLIRLLHVHQDVWRLLMARERVTPGKDTKQALYACGSALEYAMSVTAVIKVGHQMHDMGSTDETIALLYNQEGGTDVMSHMERGWGFALDQLRLCLDVETPPSGSSSPLGEGK